MTDDRWAEKTWRPYGREDPYFAVCNDDKYRRDRMDAAARDAFFASGTEHVDAILATIRKHVDPDFTPARVLDFGSGVGRLLIPLARLADHAVGIDVAPEMNAEAARNCAELGLDNVGFALSDDTLSGVSGQFDLVHSFIVFQHIPPAHGERIFEALVRHLAPGGVGALHVTYSRVAPPWRKLANRLRRRVPLMNAAVNLVQGRRAREPFFPMYEYKLDRLLEILRSHDCDSAYMTLTDHGGHHGAILFFRRATRAADSS